MPAARIALGVFQRDATRMKYVAENRNVFFSSNFSCLIFFSFFFFLFSFFFFLFSFFCKKLKKIVCGSIFRNIGLFGERLIQREKRRSMVKEPP